MHSAESSAVSHLPLQSPSQVAEQLASQSNFAGSTMQSAWQSPSQLPVHLIDGTSVHFVWQSTSSFPAHAAWSFGGVHSASQSIFVSHFTSPCTSMLPHESIPARAGETAKAMETARAAADKRSG